MFKMLHNLIHMFQRDNFVSIYNMHKNVLVALLSLDAKCF